MKRSEKTLTDSNLKVTVYWGDILYGTALVHPKEAVTIGRRADNTFVLDVDEALTFERLEIVKLHANRMAEITFDDHIDGHVKQNGKLISLASERSNKKIPKDADGLYRVRFSDKEKADVVVGHVSFYFDWVSTHESLPYATGMPRRDKTFLLLTLLLLLAFPLGIYFLGQWVPNPEPENPPERIVTIIPPELPVAKAAMGERQTADGGAQKGAAGKAEVKAEEKPSAAQLLKRSNLGSLVSGLTSLGASAPSANAEKGMKAPVAQVGTGGFTTQGLKTGGGGKSEGIGRTVGAGRGGFEGTGRLGLSGDSAVEGGTGYGRQSTVVKGGLSNDVIENVIRRRQYRIRLCYERQLNFNPKLAGKVAVHFVIGAHGEVLSANITEDTMKNQTVKKCIVDEVKTWNFPSPEGGTQVNVDYPFVFESSATAS